MLTRRVVACLDVRAGKVVKGVRFESLREVGDPAERAQEYEQQGADEIVVLDVSATLEDRLASLRSIQKIRELLSVPLTVGGGVRGVDDARRLLDAGADRVSVNSAAVLRPELIADLAREFGSQCVVIAVDAFRRPDLFADGQPRWRLAVRSGTERMELDPIRWAVRAEALGAGEVLLTSMDRDGTGSGYDVQLIEAVSSATSIPVVASGGARVPEDLSAALASGAEAVLVASMIHDGLTTIQAIKAHLMRAGFPIRRVYEETT